MEKPSTIIEPPTSQPSTNPLIHPKQLFKPRALYAHLPAFENRRLPFREHSFLDNRRTPGWVKHARTEVSGGAPRCGEPPPALCVEVNNTRPPRRVNQQVGLGQGVGWDYNSKGPTWEGDGRRPTASNRIQPDPTESILLCQLIVPAAMDDGQIWELLKPYAKAKLLHFPRPSAVFGGFKDERRRAAFELWIDSILTPWCCRWAGGLGGA